MEHTWEIQNLIRTLNDGVITSATYYCKTSLLGESARTVGEYHLATKDPSEPDFISYENLTQDIVLGWITGSLDTEAIYAKHSASIAERIDYLNSTTTTAKGLPW